MEQFVFIHGSSIGQSYIIPEECPREICEQLAQDYFRCRELRKKKSSAKIVLVVELLKIQEKTYCVYSFLLNECLGANTRQGQYFAMTFFCKEKYLFPEKVFELFNREFEVLLEQGSVIVRRDNKIVYVSPQFDKQAPYLLGFIGQLRRGFEEDVKSCYKSLPADAKMADFSTWNGETVPLDNSNAQSSYDKLCCKGRLYVSKEYKSASDTIKELEEKVKQLESANHSLKQGRDDVINRHTAGSANIYEVNKEIVALKSSNSTLKGEKEVLQSTIDKIDEVLKGHIKASKKVVNETKTSKDLIKNGTKDIVRMILQYIALILVIVTCILNICFFRTHSPASEEEGENVTDMPVQNVVQSAGDAEKQEISVVETQHSFSADGGDKITKVNANCDWTVSTPDDAWFSANKDSDTSICIFVTQNTTSSERKASFFVAASIKKIPIEVVQEKAVSANLPQSSNADYGMEVRLNDENGRKLNQNEEVVAGSKLYVLVENPNYSANGYGWEYSNCNGSSSENQKQVNVIVGSDSKKEVVISYGNKNNSNERQKFHLKINKEAGTGADTGAGTGTGTGTGTGAPAPAGSD